MYRVENIGSQFTPKTREALEQRLNREADEGWYFHSVFAVTEQTCLGQRSSTYYMVLTEGQPPIADGD